MDFSEAEVISELAQIFSHPDPRVFIGIGDDAAVYSSPRERSVVTTDMAVEGVHFRKEWSRADEIGQKITAANLADVYAMGAIPEHLVVAVSLTGEESMVWIKELARGIESEAKSCDVSVIGGDVVRGPVVTISITAIGHVDKPIVRTSAKVGDKIYFSNLPGWSAAGLHLLAQQVNISSLSPARCVERALAQFRAPEVAYETARAFGSAHAMCDVSDGLLTQAEQMATKTKFLLKSDLLRLHPDFADLAGLAAQVGADVWDWIAAGGEDHAFLAAGVDLPGYEIGEVLTGIGVELKGVARKPQGFTHFA